MELKPVGEYTSAQFREMWDEAKDLGYTRQEICTSLGITIDQFRGIVTKVNKGEEILSPPKEHLPKIEPESENIRHISSSGPYTVDKLLDDFKIDRDEWEVTRIIANSWEGYRKEDRHSLEWENGKIIKGFSEDTGDIYKKPLYQLKVTLVRKEPIAIRPVVKPVHVQFAPVPTVEYEVSDYKTALILPDTHFGFLRNSRTGNLTSLHDRIVLDLCLQVATHIAPDEIVWLGDVFDLPDWSNTFVQSPEFNMVMQPAIFECAWWKSQFGMVTDKQTVLQGNHDVRMEKALHSHMVQAFDLRSVNQSLGVSVYPVLSIPNLLGFDDADIDWIDGYPNNQYWLNDQLACEHGSSASAAPGATTGKLAKERNYSTIVGHIHRAERASRAIRDRNGTRWIYAFSPGFLGKIDGTIPGSKHTQNWNNGFGLVRYSDDGRHDTQGYFIDGEDTWFDGHMFTAVDRTEEIEELGKEKEVGFF